MSDPDAFLQLDVPEGSCVYREIPAVGYMHLMRLGILTFNHDIWKLSASPPYARLFQSHILDLLTKRNR